MKENIAISKGAEPEKAILVGLITPSQDEARSLEYLDELAFLADTIRALSSAKASSRN